MVDNRVYTTRRMGIVDALCNIIETIDSSDSNSEFNSTVLDVYPRLKFWDEVPQFPAVSVTAGLEYRQYQGGGYKDRFLNVSIKAYVEEEDAATALDALLEDIETVVENNSKLTYYDKLGVEQCTHQISIVQIETDEGVLEPIGFGEISLLVHY